MNNKLPKKIGIFLSLKTLEILGVTILSYGAYAIGKFANTKLSIGMTGWFNYWVLGIFCVLGSALFLTGLGVLIYAWLALNWEWADNLLIRFGRRK